MPSGLSVTRWGCLFAGGDELGGDEELDLVGDVGHGIAHVPVRAHQAAGGGETGLGIAVIGLADLP